MQKSGWRQWTRKIQTFNNVSCQSQPSLQSPIPSRTFTNTTSRSSSQEIVTVQMKSWDPLMLGPTLAVERRVRITLCFVLQLKDFIARDVAVDRPAPPTHPLSPPWSMMLGITMWKEEPLYWSGNPFWPTPFFFSPVPNTGETRLLWIIGILRVAVP